MEIKKRQRKGEFMKDTTKEIVREQIKKINNWELLWRVIKLSYFNWIFLMFIGAFVIFSFLFYLIEPGIKTIGDGLWYSFAVITTIGFGDLAAVTVAGRVLTVILGIIGLIIVALITGIIIDFIQERAKAKGDASMVILLQKLEDLSDMSKEELEQIEEQIRQATRD